MKGIYSKFSIAVVSFFFLGVGLTASANINSNKLVHATPTDTVRKTVTTVIAPILPLDNIEQKSAIHFQYAIRYNVPVELVSNLDLFRFMDLWIGTRYSFGGTSLRGIDCSGLTRRLLDDVYCKKVSRTVTGQFKQCKEIARDELKQGDLLFFHTTRPGLSHVGIYLGDDYFIHSGCTKGVSIESLQQKYYKNAYRKAGRIIQD
jgi:hypothetical protein